MSFEDCTITLQDVAYQLGLLIDGQYISGCLTDFVRHIEGGRSAWETFSDLPQGADDETVRRNRCMCRVTNRNVVKLASPLQLLQSWIFWRFPGFRLDEFDVFHWPLALRWSSYQPTLSDKRPRITHWRLMIDLLQPRDFLWMPYSLSDIVQVVHPEILEPRHMALWRVVTTLIYFAVIEWHPVDWVLP
ncbi:hypothetical protein Ahy_A05g022974 [Arachis hypogaea]|uniref:Aminotransferase-like plant mobile domain-containing protein n=1 Tax=Arachis hypogaea TaxID=3818 RepID=A0A445D240_ARAHY|nr:hypothetical protein Ahy_A05g022974 [Arachis hypogaea]